MRPQKITFGEMRAGGPTGILVYCADYRCSHSMAMPADQWPDDVRLSDIEPRFICKGVASAAPTFGRSLGLPGWGPLRGLTSRRKRRLACDETAYAQCKKDSDALANRTLAKSDISVQDVITERRLVEAYCLKQHLAGHSRAARLRRSWAETPELP